MTRKGSGMTTQEQTHTPGPWKVYGDPRIPGSNLSVSQQTDGVTGLFIAFVEADEDDPQDLDELLGNARLIAAAPDLLAAAYAALLEGDMTLLGPAIDKATGQ